MSSYFGKAINPIKSTLKWGDDHWSEASRIVDKMASKVPRKGQEKSFEAAIGKFRGAIENQDQGLMERLMQQVVSSKKSKMMSGGQAQKEYIERLQKL
jgi:hypothetical protein